MAAVTQQLYSSPVEGSSVFIDYDDTTLLVSALTLSCGPKASAPLTLAIMLNGVWTSLQCNLGSAIKRYVFPTALQAVKAINSKGNALTTNFGFQAVIGGHGIVPPNAVIVV